MTGHSRWILVAALLCCPALAAAQHAAHEPAAPAPAVAPAHAPDPRDATDDEESWASDDLLAFGFDEWFADAGEPGGDPGEPGEAPGGDDAHAMAGHAGMGMRMHDGGMHGGPGMGGMAMRRHAMGLRMRLSQLDLSDAQRDKLRDLHEAQARKMVQRRADMQLARMDLHKLLRAEKPDPSAINAQIDKMARMHAETMKAAVGTHLQARAILTPEQLRQLESPMGRRHGMGMEHGMMDTPGDTPKR